jgi:hypothetical protein
MGKQMFEQCYFPGIRNPEFYDAAALVQVGTGSPERLPTPTPYPTLTPYPTPKPPPEPGLFGDQNAYRKKMEQQGQEYQKRREAQGEEYRKLVEQQFIEYQEQSQQYGQDVQQEQMQQEKAVRGAEGIIKEIYQNFQTAFRGTLQSRCGHGHNQCCS